VARESGLYLSQTFKGCCEDYVSHNNTLLSPIINKLTSLSRGEIQIKPGHNKLWTQRESNNQPILPAFDRSSVFLFPHLYTLLTTAHRLQHTHTNRANLLPLSLSITRPFRLISFQHTHQRNERAQHTNSDSQLARESTVLLPSS
jgi:hypothetical protein